MTIAQLISVEDRTLGYVNVPDSTRLIRYGGMYFIREGTVSPETPQPFRSIHCFVLPRGIRDTP